MMFSKLKVKLTENVLLVLFIGTVVIFSAIAPGYFSMGNFKSMIYDVIPLFILSVGLGFVVSTGHIDLSLGAVVVISNLLVGWLIVYGGLSPIIAILAVLAIGAIVGFLNGVNVSYLGINSFVATLGMLILLRGIKWIAVGGFVPSFFTPSSIVSLATGKLFFVDNLFIFLFIVFILSFIVFRKIGLGRRLSAIGSNLRAAYISGIPTRRYTLYSFILAGLFFALAGILVSAKTAVTRFNISGTGYMISAFAIVFLGIANERGKVRGISILLAALLFQSILYGLTMLGLGSSWLLTVKGILLIIGILLLELL